MALPEGTTARTREEWTALFEDTDPKKRQIANRVLQGLGYSPMDYMTWSKEDRVDKIMEAQEASGGGSTAESSEKKGKAGGNGKVKATGGNVRAASSGGSVDPATAKLIAKMAEQIDNLQEVVAAQLKMLTDTHFLVRVLVQSNATVKANTEDPDLQKALYGQLVVSGNDD